MERKTEISRILLNDFHERWPVNRISEMTLDDYVSINNKDTFCQWLETKTKDLGSIKGVTSIKFGIYKREDPLKKPKTYVNDEIYSWQKFYGENRNEAFNNVKQEILEIIQYSAEGDFIKIDDLHLMNFVRWKIAYLFSNERLVPIFKKSVLEKISKSFGVIPNRKTGISEIQDIMIQNKPTHLSIYEYADDLFRKFGGKSDKFNDNTDSNSNLNQNTAKNTKSKRKPAVSRNTESQSRTLNSTYQTLQIHNKLQFFLFNKLGDQFGKQNVFLEENYVDITVKLENETRFYEVKSDSYASDCIKKALGQIIGYWFRDSEAKPIRLIVAGQNKLNIDEVKYLEFINRNLKFKLEYLAIEMTEIY